MAVLAGLGEAGAAETQQRTPRKVRVFARMLGQAAKWEVADCYSQKIDGEDVMM